MFIFPSLYSSFGLLGLSSSRLISYSNLDVGHPYCDQLLAIEACLSEGSGLWPEQLCRVDTPLRLGAWRRLLASHPDEAFVGYILRGIEQGFRIGYSGNREQLRAAKHNMLSAGEHPEVVSKYLEEEWQMGRIGLAGTLEEAKMLGIHCSPFGVIPKKSKPGKWRLIVDLSAPAGHSVNDGIEKELSSLHYISIDDVVACIIRLGKDAMLAKIDVKQAYRIVPVNPSDRNLLGMLWEGRVFVDTRLPFGLRSTPLIFTALADVLQWVIERKGVRFIFHYIDDFITVGTPGSVECATNMEKISQACQETGVTILGLGIGYRGIGNSPAKSQARSSAVYLG